MNTFCLEIKQTEETEQQQLLASAHQLGIASLASCQKHTLYFFQGQLTAEQAHSLGRHLLADPVIESFTVLAVGESPTSDHNHYIDVTLLPGVTDPAAENLVRAAHLLGYEGLSQAATGQRYFLHGELTESNLKRLASGLLANPVIQRFSVDRPISPPFVAYKAASTGADDTVETIPLCDAEDDALQQISRERRLALNLEEMQAIRTYYRREEREPTDVELETLAQTWSEHCVHKTFKAIIQYTGPSSADPNSPTETKQVNGLLKEYIRAATDKVDRPWVRSAFVDNAGIIAFDDQFDLAFKVETHNHPSALEPFGGANTGVGGVIRDVIGVSARPIANTDILCFGPPDLPEDALPEGVLHPRRIADGVVHGIEDYGNKMGIPTVNGAIYYHPSYTANPLVYCGCLGLLPRDSHRTTAEPGDLIIAIGGRTGRDGLRGATFSSMEMDVSTGDIAGSAVQIGNPIQEKQVLEVILKARDEGLYTAITDCGAGGFSSAVGEMGEHLGAAVQLADAPLKYPGLRPWEIWLSEAQERMVLAVPPEKWPRLQEICAGQDVEGVCIGRFEDKGMLELYYGDSQVGELSMDFLHNGIPIRHLEATWTPPTPQAGAAPEADQNTLLSLLAHPNIRSKEAVVRRYDHEVQGGMVIKPFTGATNQGPSDAAVIIPLDTQSPGQPQVGQLPNYPIT
ncbi:MAG: phosphoribosylformylglycinamidine synthase subunit PurS, partial [Candidatus Promineifilaceae bacterium]